MFFPHAVSFSLTQNMQENETENQAEYHYHKINAWGFAEMGS